MTFPEAGSSEDLHAKYMADQVTNRLQNADGLLAGAQAIMRKHPNHQDRMRAERAARQALQSYAGALNWAEDTDDEDRVHRQLDGAGRWVRKTFGCHLHYDGAGYSQRCPVALGHNRIGLSVGGAATRTCSICGHDLSDCEHRRGIAYMVPGGVSELGWCRVCLKRDDCDHRPDQEYRAGVVAIIEKMELEEVSVVSKPAHPDARFSAVPISPQELKDHLGPGFTVGMPVNCDRCLTDCDGLARHEMIHG